MAFSIKTNGFVDQSIIPAKYTADGADISPQLEWRDAPALTKSFTLIMDDPDAPAGTWVHWVLYDLPKDTKNIPEAVPKAEVLPSGAKQGITDFRQVGYGGPSPPPGLPHRYFFKLYALDCMLNLPPRHSKKDVEKAMQGHILAEAQIMGKYGR